MNYEIVELKEKTLVGVSARTSNDSSEMQSIIGGLWNDFYNKGIYGGIKNRKNEFAIGLYCDYTDKDYCVMVGSEVDKNENAELAERKISSGKYAKFSVHGNMVTAVAQAWSEIWKLDLPRSFTGDFEEYVGYDGTDSDIDIYIALK